MTVNPFEHQPPVREPGTTRGRDMDVSKPAPPREQSLVAELAGSAMLFGLTLGSTAGVVGLAQLAVRVLS